MEAQKCQVINLKSYKYQSYGARLLYTGLKPCSFHYTMLPQSTPRTIMEKVDITLSLMDEVQAPHIYSPFHIPVFGLH